MPTIDASSSPNKDRKTLHRKLLARCHHSDGLKTMAAATSLPALSKDTTMHEDRFTELPEELALKHNFLASNSILLCAIYTVHRESAKNHASPHRP
ncbi:hypothetical protein NC653_041777 [Populus alba x Populus x berolinensis]|uniref:Uncharacterized protein n=1 Tax=Populus alba x Populus x berolinensis TaxID=444605 RepID=A0AAD6L9D4_9ROSI|nr:hypothetical protein NC653_041777 [Populus alba x Populus x berolinensis]